MCEVLLITKNGQMIVGGTSKFFMPKQIDIELSKGEQALFYARQPQVIRKRPRATKKELLMLLTTSQAAHIGFGGGSRNRRVERLWY